MRDNQSSKINAPRIFCVQYSHIERRMHLVEHYISRTSMSNITFHVEHYISRRTLHITSSLYISRTSTSTMWSTPNVWKILLSGQFAGHFFSSTILLVDGILCEGSILLRLSSITSVSELPIVTCADCVKDAFTCLVFIKGGFRDCGNANPRLRAPRGGDGGG